MLLIVPTPMASSRRCSQAGGRRDFYSTDNSRCVTWTEVWCLNRYTGEIVDIRRPCPDKIGMQALDIYFGQPEWVFLWIH